jgi:nitrite reductase/ring-hydroxylating ferredoxin subunit
MPVFTPLDRLGTVTALDPTLRRLSATVTRLPAAVRDALHGVWLGHPLHPALAQVPVGAWLAAAVLDGAAAVAPSAAVRAGAERSARVLLATGLLSAPVAALPGVADWSGLHPEQQRIGAVHALTNTAATCLFAASLVQRRRGRAAAGRALGMLGVAVAGSAAGIGGHLAYRHAAGPNHAEHVPHRTDGRWHVVDRLELLPDRMPAQYVIGGTTAVVVRRGDEVGILADACSHLGGPLTEGSLEDDTLVCPWHGSAFRLDDGTVRHGPATAPQPRFDVRVTDGVVEARISPAT